MARVLIHTLVFTPDCVSNAYLYRDLALELQRRGHRVTVLTATPHYNLVEKELLEQPLTRYWGGIWATSKIGEVRVVHLPVLQKSSRALVRALSAAWFHFASITLGVACVGRQDVILTSSPPLSIGLTGALIARLWCARSGYIIQDVFPDGLIRQGKIRNKLLISILRWLERIVYDANDVVVVIAHSFIPTIQPRMRRPNRLKLIENFVDTEFYRPLPRINDFSFQYGLDEQFVVSYIGNIGNAQDLSPLVKAAEDLRSLPIVFVVIGDGILRPNLEREVRERELKNVLILGYLPREKTPWANASSDVGSVLLSPHVCGDGFPSKIFSIMGSGRASIVTADEGSDLMRVAAESGCVRVVPVGEPAQFVEAVRQAFNERKSLVEEGQRARQYVISRYSKEAAGAKYDQLITRLVAPRGSGGTP